MSEKYVCKNCGYIYPKAHYERSKECIHCYYGGELTKRDVKEALALAREIKDRVYWND